MNYVLFELFATRYSPVFMRRYQATVTIVAVISAFILHRYARFIRFGWITWGAAVGTAFALGPDDWPTYVPITDSLNFYIDSIRRPFIGIAIGIAIDLLHHPPERNRFGIKQLLLIVAIFAILAWIFVSYFKQPGLP